MRDWKKHLRPLYYAARGLWYRGRRRHCALCRGSFRRFLEKGVPPRPEAMCPRCLSLERHRLLGVFLERKAVLRGVASLLHFAPEPGLRQRFATQRGLRYVSADRTAGRGIVALDLSRLGLQSESFEAVLCCHVLEHVADDGAAMRELFRVLRPGGSAVLQVPLREGSTDEDPNVVDPAERLRRFGQEDHLRLYGAEDFPARLRNAGFRVEIFHAPDFASAGEIEAGRLWGGEGDDAIFVATRPASF